MQWTHSCTPVSLAIFAVTAMLSSEFVASPTLPGESEFQGIFVKRECHATDPEAHLAMVVLERNLRKLGQHQQDALAGPTAGLFESTTYFQALLSEPIEDRAARARSTVTRFPFIRLREPRD